MKVKIVEYKGKKYPLLERKFLWFFTKWDLISIWDLYKKGIIKRYKFLTIEENESDATQIKYFYKDIESFKQDLIDAVQESEEPKIIYEFEI